MAVFKTISIVIYGNIEVSANAWIKWLENSKELLDMINITPNYIGVTGEMFMSGKILQLSRAKTRLDKSLKIGESISSIAMYSLPENFIQAAFDYNIYLSRSIVGKYNHILFTINGSFLKKLDIEMTIRALKQHINFTNGEVFEMLNIESPQFYAAKIKSANSCKTLNVLSTF